MGRVFALSAVLTLTVIVVTQVSCYAVWGGMSGGYDTSIIVAGVLIPLATCLPISMVLLLQRQKLAEVVANLESAHRELQRRASRDPMTGLLYRQAFFEELASAGYDYGSFLMIDVDHFKSVNDTHGHGAGDEALRLIAKALQDAVGPSGPISRFGGEEFCIFLPNTSASEGHKLGEQIRRQIGKLHFSPNGKMHRLTVSVGIAATQSGETVEAAISSADAALYEAKGSGRNRVVCAPDRGRGRNERNAA